MAQDPIDKYDGTEPKSTTKVKNGPTVIPLNWDAVENMVGLGMYGLEITQTAGKTATIDYTSLTLVQNTATPPLIFVDLSPSQIAMDWDNGNAMNGLETGLGTGAGWKYLWVYRDAVNGVTSGLWSAATAIGSVAEPDANFKFGRLVGAGYWNGVAAFTAFTQSDKIVDYKANNQILTSGRSDATWAQISLAAVIPSIATHIWCKADMFTASGTPTFSTLYTAADNSANYAQGYVLGDLAAANSGFGGNFMQKVTSQNVSYQTNETAGTIRSNIFVTGYRIKI